MKKVKSITITTCVVFSSIVMFSASVLAAPAIVNSDPSLKFDDVKLQRVLTSISDKEPSLNVVFYSTNTFSPNTVVLPDGSKINKAIHANDNFIGSIKRPNYISLFYNKDLNNPNKGSFSVNVGSDFRTLISTQDISTNIVKPNISKYLPQDPEAFIPVVAEQVVVRIKAKQQQLATEIENKRIQVIKDVESKQAWDSAVSFMVTMSIRILFVLIILYLVDKIVKGFKSASNEYKKYKDLLEQINVNYTQLVEQSVYLTGYTGVTAKKTKDLLDEVTRINQLYLDLKALPRFINTVLNNSTWSNYTANLTNMSGSLSQLLSLIKQFIASIEGLSGTDPLAEVIRLQKLEEETKQYNNLLIQANNLYNDGSEYAEQSSVHTLFKAVKDATNLVDRQVATNAYYPVVSKEYELIKQLKRLKQGTKEAANYIISNNNTYYSNLDPITKEVKDWAQNLLVTASNYNNYYELSNIKTINQELDLFAIDYKQQDTQYRVTEERKSSLISKVNFSLPSNFVPIQNRLLQQIKRITINDDYTLTEQTLDKLEIEVNALIKDVRTYNHNVNSLVYLVNGKVPNKFEKEQIELLAKYNNIAPDLLNNNLESLLEEANSFSKKVNSYKIRHDKISNYSGTRKEELTEQLDNNNYQYFDTLIVNYNLEDNRSRSSYSSLSYSSYNSSPNSYSNDSSSYSDSSSSSSSSNWSSSSSDDSSWSSSSSDDSFSSSSSSDDSW